MDEEAWDATSWDADADADGWPDESVRVDACELPSAYLPYVSTMGCDDADASISPGATLVCDNGVDEDCTPNNAECGFVGEAAFSDGVWAAVTYAGGLDARFSTSNLVSLDRSGDGHSDVGLVGSCAWYIVTGPQVYPGPSNAARGCDVTDADSIGMADVGAVTSDGEDEVALLRELPTPGACIFDGGSSTTPHYDDALVPIDTTSVAVEALGDIDGSGSERFAIIANTEGRVELYTSTDTGTVPVPDLVVSSTASFAPDAAGGLGGDGVQDLLVGDDSFGCSTTCGAIWVFVGPTTGDLDLAGADVVLGGPADTRSAGAVGGFGFDLEAGGDLDGDADLIVPALANEHLPLFTGPFAGTIDLATDEPVARRTGSAAGTGAVGDVDADGDGELAVLCWDDSPIWVLYIVAGGSSSWPTTPVQRAARAPSGLEWLVAPPPDPCHSELRVFRPMPPRNAFSECTRVHGHE